MLLDQRDRDILRLIGLCKDVPSDCSPLQCDMFSPASFAALTGAGYIRKSRCGLSYRLTDKGYTLLTSLGCSAERDAVPVGNGATLRRRLEVAKTVLSMYRARIKVFGDEGDPLMSYTPIFLFRRKSKGQLLGTSKLCGILHLKNQTIPVYFITEQSALYEGVEIAAINRIAALLQSPDNTAALFLADSTEILERFQSPFPFGDVRSIWGNELLRQLEWQLYEPPAKPLEVSLYA